MRPVNSAICILSRGNSPGARASRSNGAACRRLGIYFNCIPLALAINDSTPFVGTNFTSIGCPDSSFIPNVQLKRRRVRTTARSLPVAIGLHNTACTAPSAASSDKRRVGISRLKLLGDARSLSKLCLVTASSPCCRSCFSSPCFSGCSLPVKGVAGLCTRRNGSRKSCVAVAFSDRGCPLGRKCACAILIGYRRGSTDNGTVNGTYRKALPVRLGIIPRCLM